MICAKFIDARAAVCIAVSIIAAGPAAALDLPAVSFGPDASGATSFRTPSSNIECIFIPAGGTKVYKPATGGPELSCDRAKPVYTRYQLGPAGRATATTNVGDQGCCGGDHVLAYGTRWVMGPFECASTAAGLKCTRTGGRGFVISQAKAKLF